MNRTEKKFMAAALAAIFVLLTVLLGIINCVNFTMAANDADRITAMLADRRGFFPDSSPQAESQETQDFDQSTDKAALSPLPPDSVPREMGPMGPNSPEMNASLRYFTISFSPDSNEYSIVAFHLSALTEEEAAVLAGSLRNEKTGWVNGTYRYRVYGDGEHILVTVIDQARELLPSYRILAISGIGLVVGMLISVLVLWIVGQKLFLPIRDVDRKQKKFIENVEAEFKIPLTVINAGTELIEKEYGPDENTSVIRRQVRLMSKLFDKLQSLSVYDTQTEPTEFDLSGLLSQRLERRREQFSSRAIEMSMDIESDIRLHGDTEAFKRAFDELIDNAFQYSERKFSVSLSKEGERIKLTFSNDTKLPEGSVDQVFDRFTVLGNAEPGSSGLGLSFVRDIVRTHKGRISASVDSGLFTVRITL